MFPITMLNDAPIVRFRMVQITVNQPSFCDSAGSRMSNFVEPWESAIASSTSCWSSKSKGMISQWPSPAGCCPAIASAVCWAQEESLEVWEDEVLLNLPNTLIICPASSPNLRQTQKEEKPLYLGSHYTYSPPPSRRTYSFKSAHIPYFLDVQPHYPS